ncbi:MAG: outer membrane beta-barrel protein [Rhodothermales bacterium]|nr:outer membrane beta-barrel protein [Rhodothermales bacterium]
MARPSVYLILLIVACIGMQPASAQETRLYLGSGVTFPAGPGDVVDFWNRGLTVDVGVGRRFQDRLEFTASVGRARLPIASDKLLAIGADIETGGGDFAVSSARLGVRLEFERGTWFRPYLHVGVGAYRVVYEELEITVANPQEACGQPTCSLTFGPAERGSSTVPGMQLGAGIAYYLTDGMWLYAEPSYHIMFATERTGLVPLRIGIARSF